MSQLTRLLLAFLSAHVIDHTLGPHLSSRSLSLSACMSNCIIAIHLATHSLSRPAECHLGYVYHSPSGIKWMALVHSSWLRQAKTLPCVLSAAAASLSCNHIHSLRCWRFEASAFSHVRLFFASSVHLSGNAMGDERSPIFERLHNLRRRIRHNLSGLYLHSGG